MSTTGQGDGARGGIHATPGTVRSATGNVKSRSVTPSATTDQSASRMSTTNTNVSVPLMPALLFPFAP